MQLYTKRNNKNYKDYQKQTLVPVTICIHDIYYQFLIRWSSVCHLKTAGVFFKYLRKMHCQYYLWKILQWTPKQIWTIYMSRLF